MSQPLEACPSTELTPVRAPLDVDPVPTLGADTVLRLGVTVRNVETSALLALLVRQRVVVLPFRRFPPAPDPV